MTREEFINELDSFVFKYDYSYQIEGDKIAVTSGDVQENFDLYLKSIPSDVIFRNLGYVKLPYIDNIPSGVDFRNGDEVRLSSVTSIEKDVRFNNHGKVYLKSIVGGYFQSWPGNIEGINSKRLLNLMIKQGVFI